MLQHVNTVLIGKNIPTAFTNLTALAVGDVALFDENKKLLANANDAAAAKEIYIGAVKGTVDAVKPDGTIEVIKDIAYSQAIQSDTILNMTVTPFVAAKEDKVVIDFTNVTPVVGHRYVLRLIYTDIVELPGQYTYTEEVIASTENAVDLINSLFAKINKRTHNRVIAAKTATSLTLTAKTKTDNEGKDSINEYSQVAFEAVMWKTIPGGILSNAMLEIDGLTITKTPGTPGKGNAKIIRDRENAALGYKGITFRTHWPVVKPDLLVDLSTNYDTMTIENDNKYLSPDNQYIKTTPIATELYVTAGKMAASTLFTNMIKSFIQGKAVTA